jgi:hypothetical protein
MRYLVDFHHDTAQTDIDNYLAVNGCTVLKEWDNFDKVFLVECNNAPEKTAIIEHIVLEEAQGIQLLDVTPVDNFYISHNNPNAEKIIVDVTDDKSWWKNYSFAAPVFEGNLELNRYGELINVYVLDSGIEASHPEFVDAKIENVYSVMPNDFTDRTGHGTSIASVIVGKTCGITNSTIKVVKVFDPTHTTMLSELLSALDAIIADHSPDTFGVVNCSWIMEKNSWVENKLKRLVDNGMFIIASAGNQGTEIEETTPASMMEALTVGAYNRQLKPCDFSNYTGGSLISVTSGATNHGELDGWAPGEEIWAAGLNGTYGYVAGTSIAAGITSAIAAGLLYWHSDEQGKKLRGFEDFAINSAITGSTNEIFRKGNLLDLSDPKYASCKNALATIISKHIVALNQAPDEFNMVFRAGEKTKNIRVLEPYFTLSYEMLDPLPNNFEILPDGRIYGTPTLEQGPSDGEEYKLYTCRFNRTNTQNETELVTVNMYVLASNAMPSSDLPEDHPINILAQAVCNSPPQSQCGVNYPQACSNACGFACCLPDFGKSATCTCY